MAVPVLSIGITTFDRVAFLEECLGSILSCRSLGIEILVGNDNPARTLRDLKIVGLDDPRVHCFDHAVNMGEISNMNFLLDQAQGKYFTWIADDDVYFPDFFRALQQLIQDHPDQEVFLTNYAQGGVFAVKDVLWQDKVQILPSYGFLEAYLSRRLKTIGCYGVFKTDFLKRLGGMRRLGSGFSPYSDYLLTIGIAQSRQVIYVDAPLVFFRTHQGSLSYGSEDILAYITAQKDVLRLADEILSTDALKPKRSLYVHLLWKWFISDFMAVYFRTKAVRLSAVRTWLRLLGAHFKVMSVGHCSRVVLYCGYYFMTTLSGVCRHYLKRFLVGCHIMAEKG
ncbi:MAG: glycosyltransferase family 2 protein [Candidatus Omnitrophica bacterium]|nr:glycosyltransferase family 2 protein [Candidatus Omnitrophota bacterium]